MSEPNILLRDSVRKAHRRASHTAQASRGTGRRYQQSAFEFLFYESTTLKLYCTRYKAYYVPEYDLRYGCVRRYFTRTWNVEDRLAITALQP